MKYILVFSILFLFINSNQSMADIKDCNVIEDKIKKKNCLIENKAEKLKKQIKEKSSDVKEKIASEMKPTLKKHKKFQEDSPKTLFDLFKKIKNK
tara:strand:+ start:282 stop:566 length:285 start_codon:yes stop_codon:yes gene_type:complete